MKAVEKQMRKIRKDIRNKAKVAGMQAAEYRRKNGYTSGWIQQQAESLAKAIAESDQDNLTSAGGSYEPYTAEPGKDSHSNLASEKPFLIVVRSELYELDFLMEHKSDNSYLPIEKIHGLKGRQALSLVK